MLVEHRGRRPQIDPSAYVAPSAVLSGQVVVGPGARVLHQAVLTAEDGPVVLGTDVVVMEHALVRGRGARATHLGDAVLVGPHAHVNGADVEHEAFLATQTTVLPGAVVGARCEVRVNAVVHVNTRLPAETVVPIGWVAVGNPAQLFSSDQHEELWGVQQHLGFPETVYGVERGTSMRELMRRQSEYYGSHLDDTVVTDAGRDGQ